MPANTQSSTNPCSGKVFEFPYNWGLCERLRFTTTLCYAELRSSQADRYYSYVAARLVANAQLEIRSTNRVGNRNAHTRFAYEVVQKECNRLGVSLPPTDEHAYKADVLAKEEMEYELADYLLCPSSF